MQSNNFLLILGSKRERERERTERKKDNFDQLHYLGPLVPDSHIGKCPASQPGDNHDCDYFILEFIRCGGVAIHASPLKNLGTVIITVTLSEC